MLRKVKNTDSCSICSAKRSAWPRKDLNPRDDCSASLAGQSARAAYNIFSSLSAYPGVQPVRPANLQGELMISSAPSAPTLKFPSAATHYFTYIVGGSHFSTLPLSFKLLEPVLKSKAKTKASKTTTSFTDFDTSLVRL